MIKKILFPQQRGFTLIELMVALGVFIIIVTIATGGFVSALRSQRQVSALISANNNVSLAIEQMAREIRTGRNFCEPSCPFSNPPSSPPSYSQLSFYNARGEFVTYRKDPGGGDFIERGIGTSFERITGVGAFVWNLRFFVSGDQVLDPLKEWPTRVTVALEVSAKEQGISGGVIRLQTTVSSRQADE